LKNRTVTRIYCPGSLFFAIDEEKNPGKWKRTGSYAGVKLRLAGHRPAIAFFEQLRSGLKGENLKIFFLELFMNVLDSIAVRSGWGMVVP